MPARLTPDLNDPQELDRLFAPVGQEPALALGVSGGPDSLALMLLARRWADRAGRPRLHVFSVDHRLRPEAGQEVAMVMARARELGLEAAGLAWDGAKPESGLQEAARTARYELIGAAMAQRGIGILLTAHHRADQAETVLMRLAHGSGIEGLRGMAPLSLVHGVRVFRPLLDIEPGALRAVVDVAGWVPASDPSNDDPAYERVRWRKAMPVLAELGLDSDVLSTFAARMAAADEALGLAANAAFTQMVVLDGFGAARIALDHYLGLPASVAQRVLARVLNIVGGRQRPRALGQVERLHESLVSGSLPRSTTLLGCVVRLKDGAIAIAREPGRALPADAIVTPRGELVWDERFRIVNGSDDADLVASVAEYLPRHRLEEVLGFKVTSPAEAIRTAPIVRDAAGGVLSLGGWSFDPRISVQLLID